jgi:hypothetical protein
MSQLQGVKNFMQYQGTLRATLVLCSRMFGSKFRDAAPVAGQPPIVAKALSLPPPLSLRAGGPLSSHPPQLPELPFAPHQPKTATEKLVQLSSTILTQADIEYAAVPKLQTNDKRPRRQSPVQNFSLPTFHPTQPRRMTRYYASAFTPEEKVALAEGEENHNLKSWTEKDLIFHEETLKDLRPTNVSTGPDEQVCIIPVVIVTDGQEARTHKQQLFHKLYKSRVSSAPAVPQAVSGTFAQERAHVLAASRTASTGSYFSNNHRPVSYRPPYPSASGARFRSPLANEVSHYQPRQQVTFDSILVPHRSGEGETYQSKQNAHLQKAKKTMGI